MLGQGQDVGLHPDLLVAVHGAELAETGLRLVVDQQRAPPIQLLAQCGQVLDRQLDHAAGADDRFHDYRRRPARALFVQGLQAVVEGGETAALGVALVGTAIAIGRWHGVDVGNARAVPGAGAEIAHGPGDIGEAVEGEAQRPDSRAAGGAAGQQDRAFVGVGARLQEHGARQRRIECFSEPLRERDLGHVVEDRAGMGKRLGALRDGLGHPRIVVAERRAHLAGIEVQVFLSRSVPNQAVLGARENGAFGSGHDVGQDTGGESDGRLLPREALFRPPHPPIELCLSNSVDPECPDLDRLIGLTIAQTRSFVHQLAPWP